MKLRTRQNTRMRSARSYKVMLDIRPFATPPAPGVIDWPPVENVTPFQAPASPAQNMPAEGQATALARVAGSQITRVTGPNVASTFGINYTRAQPVYALQNVFSANDPATGKPKWFILQMMDLTLSGANQSPTQFRTYVFNAATRQPHSAAIGIAPGNTFGVNDQWRWSRTDPDLVFTVYPGAFPQLYQYHVVTRQLTIRRDFSAEGYVNMGASIMGGSGEASDDDVMPLTLEHSSRGWELVLYDIPNDTIVSTITLPNDISDVNGPNSCGMSADGQYVTIQSTHTPTGAQTTAAPWFTSRGVHVFDAATGNWQRVFRNVGGGGATAPEGHSGHAVDTDGNACWVAFGPDDADVSTGASTSPEYRHVVLWRLDGVNPGGGAQPFYSRRMTPEGLTFGYQYVRGVAPGWALVQELPWNTNNAGRAGHTLSYHAYLVKLDGSQEVRPVCDLNFIRSDFAVGSSYYATPFLVPDDSMTQFIGMFPDPVKTLSSVMDAYIIEAALQQ